MAFFLNHIAFAGLGKHLHRVCLRDFIFPFVARYALESGAFDCEEPSSVANPDAYCALFAPGDVTLYDVVDGGGHGAV